jgi:hypothetical protein
MRKLASCGQCAGIGILVIGVFLLQSCAGTRKDSVDHIEPVSGVSTRDHVILGSFPEVRRETHLPDQYGESTVRAAKVDGLKLEADLVISAVTIRPRTEVREGPGVEFNLSASVLPASERVLVYELVGSWRRIVSPGRGVKGWVHRGTLRFEYHDAKKKPDLAGTKVTISPLLLPLVFAARPVTQVYRYPGLEPLRTAIPAGAQFYMLKESNGRKLIWLTETNSVVWVKSGEML